MQYYKNKNVILLSYHIPIKSLPVGKKVPRSLIAPSINEVECSGAWKFVACHCSNGSHYIQFIGFDQFYSPVTHADSFRINISISTMHRRTTKILGVSNAFQNKSVNIHERVCVSPSPYYLYWFKIITPIFLSIDMTVHFFFNALIE